MVIGCGPAGLALAAESAKLGLRVGLIGPDLPFTNNYGVWEDEFIGIYTFWCVSLLLQEFKTNGRNVLIVSDVKLYCFLINFDFLCKQLLFAWLLLSCLLGWFRYFVFVCDVDCFIKYTRIRIFNIYKPDSCVNIL